MKDIVTQLQEYNARRAKAFSKPNCPTCKGKGYVQVVVDSNRDEVEDELCPSCLGTKHIDNVNRDYLD